MANLRFVHTADLHLDSPVLGQRATAPDQVRLALRDATFKAYENIIDLCIEEEVDALLIAGDIYDGADRSLRAQLKFREGLDDSAEPPKGPDGRSKKRPGVYFRYHDARHGSPS